MRIWLSFVLVIIACVFGSFSSANAGELEGIAVFSCEGWLASDQFGEEPERFHEATLLELVRDTASEQISDDIRVMWGEGKSSPIFDSVGGPVEIALSIGVGRSEAPNEKTHNRALWVILNLATYGPGRIGKGQRYLGIAFHRAKLRTDRWTFLP